MKGLVLRAHPKAWCKPCHERFVPRTYFLALFLYWGLTAAVHAGEETLSVQPLSMAAAANWAVRDNPGLAEMQARYEALLEIPSQLGALPDPVLSFNALNLPTDTFDLDQEAMTQLQVGLVQAFPFPGKLALKEEASKMDAQAAGHSVEEQKLRLISNVKRSWWQLYYLDHALDVVDSNQALLRNFVEVAQTKYEVGDGLQQDVLLAQLELSRLIDRKIHLEAIRRSQGIQLNVLMDMPANDLIVLPGSISEQLPAIAEDSILYQRAGINRPLFKEQASHINAAQSRLDLAKREYYPDFKVGVAYGSRRGDNPQPLGGSRADLLSLRFSVNVPIHTGSVQDKAVNQRYRELLQNNYAMQDAVSTVHSDISVATTTYRRASEQFSLFKDGIIPQARQTVASMLAGYQVNEVDFLNLVRSQVTLFNYELRYWKALAEANQALASLAAAVGEENIHD